MLEQAKKQNVIDVAGDQTGSPTWSRLIAEATSQILARDPQGGWGIYHMTCAGETSRHDFAEAIFKMSGESPMPSLNKVSSSHYKTAAKRPSYSVMNNQKLYDAFHIRLPYWTNALALCLEKTP
jgi:dTDP-4-dehydrorhamnose reductase